jgi:hypothetical protein
LALVHQPNKSANRHYDPSQNRLYDFHVVTCN